MIYFPDETIGHSALNKIAGLRPASVTESKTAG
jgi:hypothetical protein